MSTPRGKIGRMSAEDRAQVNALIHDNRPAEEIIALCKKLGARGVTAQNVSSWKGNGYLEWERRQERLEGMASRREFAVDLARKAAADGDADLTLASNTAAAVAVDTIEEVLEEFDPAHLKDLLAEKPQLFMHLLDSLAGLRKGDQAMIQVKMAYDQYRAKVREQAQLLAALADGDKAASPEDLKAISKELYGV